jgi:hypothetical protein
MEYWWFIVLISAFLVGLVAYFLWRQFYMRPADVSEPRGAGRASHYRRGKGKGTEDIRRADRESDAYRVEEEHHRGSQEQSPPLS